MQKIKIGDKLQIHCYKHNGKLHRICDEATVLDIGKDYLICANNKTRMIEKNSIFDKYYHSYITKEPAILFFYKNRWFNVISQFKEKGLYYYCNIASPYIIDDGLIKYIDYDLDLRIFPDGYYKVLDKREYKLNKKYLKYDNKLDSIIHYELDNLIKMYKDKKGPFDRKVIKYYEKLYKNFKNNY